MKKTNRQSVRLVRRNGSRLASRPTRAIPNSEFRIPPSGFTLVEMLVSVGVVLIMMTLFATIFGMATNAMSTQKGNAENDQRVRLVETLLRNDLNGAPTDPITKLKTKQIRTFRVLIPYGAGESIAPINPVTGTTATASDRSGYFYISENNPYDDTDDKLQFTVQMGTNSSELIYGRAAGLFPDAAGHYGPADSSGNYVTPPPALPTLAPPGNYWTNQPEFDDLLFYPNQAGGSSTAEVSYFLRNGTLYRRVMLLRDPNPPSGVTVKDQPSDDAGVALSLAAYTSPGGPSFYRDFDYSVYYNGTPQFHGFQDLTNSNVASTLLNPAYRWGFDGTSALNAGFGLPREYDSNTPARYFGGFTHADTSDSNFGFPGVVTAVYPNPMAFATNLSLSNGQITVTPGGGNPTYTFAGSRISEDVILTNVLAFDVKVWDPAASLGPDGAPGIAGFDDDGINGPDDYLELGAYGSDDGDWRDIGHPGYTPPTSPPYTVPAAPQRQPPYGFYNSPLAVGGLPNSYYSNPFATPATNRFDTWGPAVQHVTSGTNDPPPYRPIYAGRDGKPGVATFNDDFTGLTDDYLELGTAGTDDFAPLTAIKITIRFYDKTSKQVRDISGIYSLVYQP